MDEKKKNIESPWMPLRDASSYLGRGRQFLAREIAQGRLRAARIGGRGEMFTRREWCDAYVEERAKPVVVVGRRAS
jgi:hypothetical protein